MKIHTMLEVIRVNHISNMHEFTLVQDYLPELGLPSRREFIEQSLKSWSAHDPYDGSTVEDKMIEAAFAGELNELKLHPEMKVEHDAIMDKLHQLLEADRKKSPYYIDVDKLNARFNIRDKGVW